MSKPAARLGDLSTPDPCGAPPSPIASGSGDVFADGMPVSKVGDPIVPHACPSSPPHPGTIAAGSGTVMINGSPAARLGDSISCGSTIAVGSGTVFIGD